MEESPCPVKDKLNRISRLLGDLLPEGSDNKENTVRPKSSTSDPVFAHSPNAYFERLGSFGPGVWGVVEVSPVECAQRGWRLIQPDVIQCVTCKQVVCAGLPSPTDRQAYSQFLERLKGQVVEGHHEACWWRHNPSPDHLTHPPQLVTQEDLRNLTNTAHTLAALESALPHFEISCVMELLGVNDEVVEGLYSTQGTPTPVQVAAALLVLSGWSRGTGAYLRCKVCCRAVGLWCFVTRADVASGTTATQTPQPLTPGKRKVRDSEGSGEEGGVFSSPEKTSDHEDTQTSWRLRLRERRVSDQSTPEEPQLRKRRGSERSRKGSVSGQTDAKEPASPLVIGTSPSTQIQKVEKHPFHPLEEHRHWCPWVMLEKGRETKGYHTVVESVKNIIKRSRRNTSPSSSIVNVGNIEGVRSLRTLLGDLGAEEHQT